MLELVHQQKIQMALNVQQAQDDQEVNSILSTPIVPLENLTESILNPTSSQTPSQTQTQSQASVASGTPAIKSTNPKPPASSSASRGLPPRSGSHAADAASNDRAARMPTRVLTGQSTHSTGTSPSFTPASTSGKRGSILLPASSGPAEATPAGRRSITYGSRPLLDGKPQTKPGSAGVRQSSADSTKTEKPETATKHNDVSRDKDATTSTISMPLRTTDVGSDSAITTPIPTFVISPPPAETQHPTLTTASPSPSEVLIGSANEGLTRIQTSAVPADMFVTTPAEATSPMPSTTSHVATDISLSAVLASASQRHVATKLNLPVSAAERLSQLKNRRPRTSVVNSPLVSPLMPPQTSPFDLNDDSAHMATPGSLPLPTTVVKRRASAMAQLNKRPDSATSVEQILQQKDGDRTSSPQLQQPPQSHHDRPLHHPHPQHPTPTAALERAGRGCTHSIDKSLAPRTADERERYLERTDYALPKHYHSTKFVDRRGSGSTTIITDLRRGSSSTIVTQIHQYLIDDEDEDDEDDDGDEDDDEDEDEDDEDDEQSVDEDEDGDLEYDEEGYERDREDRYVEDQDEDEYEDGFTGDRERDSNYNDPGYSDDEAEYDAESRRYHGEDDEEYDKPRRRELGTPASGPDKATPGDFEEDRNDAHEMDSNGLMSGSLFETSPGQSREKLRDTDRTRDHGSRQLQRQHSGASPDHPQQHPQLHRRPTYHSGGSAHTDMPDLQRPDSFTSLVSSAAATAAPSEAWRIQTPRPVSLSHHHLLQSSQIATPQTPPLDMSSKATTVTQSPHETPGQDTSEPSSTPKPLGVGSGKYALRLNLHDIDADPTTMSTGQLGPDAPVQSYREPLPRPSSRVASTGTLQLEDSDSIVFDTSVDASMAIRPPDSGHSHALEMRHQRQGGRVTPSQGSITPTSKSKGTPPRRPIKSSIPRSSRSVRKDGNVASGKRYWSPRTHARFRGVETGVAASDVEGDDQDSQTLSPQASTSASPLSSARSAQSAQSAQVIGATGAAQGVHATPRRPGASSAALTQSRSPFIRAPNEGPVSSQDVTSSLQPSETNAGYSDSRQHGILRGLRRRALTNVHERAIPATILDRALRAVAEAAYELKKASQQRKGEAGTQDAASQPTMSSPPPRSPSPAGTPAVEREPSVVEVSTESIQIPKSAEALLHEYARLILRAQSELSMKTKQYWLTPLDSTAPNFVIGQRAPIEPKPYAKQEPYPEQLANVDPMQIAIECLRELATAQAQHAVAIARQASSSSPSSAGLKTSQTAEVSGVGSSEVQNSLRHYADTFVLTGTLPAQSLTTPVVTELRKALTTSREDRTRPLVSKRITKLVPIDQIPKPQVDVQNRPLGGVTRQNDIAELPFPSLPQELVEAEQSCVPRGQTVPNLALLRRIVARRLAFTSISTNETQNPSLHDQNLQSSTTERPRNPHSGAMIEWQVKLKSHIMHSVMQLIAMATQQRLKRRSAVAPIRRNILQADFPTVVVAASDQSSDDAPVRIHPQEGSALTSLAVRQSNDLKLIPMASTSRTIRNTTEGLKNIPQALSATSTMISTRPRTAPDTAFHADGAGRQPNEPKVSPASDPSTRVVPSLREQLLSSRGGLNQPPGNPSIVLAIEPAKDLATERQAVEAKRHMLDRVVRRLETQHQVMKQAEQFELALENLTSSGRVVIPPPSEPSTRKLTGPGRITQATSNLTRQRSQRKDRAATFSMFQLLKGQGKEFSQINRLSSSSSPGLQK